MNIKQTIKDYGFTISEVAQKLGCSQSALSQSISTNPTTSRLREISAIIGCKMSDFFSDEESSNYIICPHCGKRIEIETK